MRIDWPGSSTAAVFSHHTIESQEGFASVGCSLDLADDQTETKARMDSKIVIFLSVFNAGTSR
jgi:hypothetical protein